MYKYWKNASLYKELGIKWTTYEISFNELLNIIGNIDNKILLDFWCWTWRTTRYLKSLWAKRIFWVDHDKDMIAEAKTYEENWIEFNLIEDKIPFEKEYFDWILSAHVFPEINSFDKMRETCIEIAKVIKKNGFFIIISTNPEAFWWDFKNYSYDKPKFYKSWELVNCNVKASKPFIIKDVYWKEEDYINALKYAWFEIENIKYPKALEWEWLDEFKIAPDIIIKAIKK